MLEMKRDGGLFPGELTLSTDTALTQFAQGNVGMMIVTNRDFTLLSRIQPLSFTLGIAKPPVLEAGDKGKGALMIDPEPPFVINAFTGHPQEAAKLWEYLLSPEYLGALYKAGDIIPAREDVLEDPQYQPPHSDFAAFLPNGEDSPYPQVPRFILQNIPTPYLPKNVGDAGRIKAYRDILQEIRPAGEALQDLTRQFDDSLNEAAHNQKLININDYVFPDFDPRHPLAQKSVEN
jgi:multiple sugar transport system substrate-binding protein